MTSARAVCLAVLLIAPTVSAQAAPPTPASVRQNMEFSVRALQREKASRTPAQRKIASKLLYGARMRRGEPVARGIPRLRDNLRWAADGTTQVDIRADVNDALLEAIASLGGRVESAFPRYHAVRAHLPEHAIESLAERDDVRHIRPAAQYVLRKDDTSEGDVAHRADDLRVAESIDGTGASVGVMSDGVDTLAARQASGDLPAGVTVLAGAGGSGDEGTAMLEIVFDLAPGASLLFATAGGGEASFATNILDLETAGADVIVDDIGYFNEGVFQDGVIAAAIDAVTANGVLFVSAAGNDGNENDSTSGVYEGDYVASTTAFGGGFLHEFAVGFVDNTITVDTPNVFTLKWSDPLGGSGNDYDLYLFDTTGTAIDSSVDIQDGDDDPIESISSAGFDDTGNRLGIVNFGGSDRMLHLHTFGGELEFSTSGAIYGHPGANGAIAAAAADWFFAGGAGGEFDGTEVVETFSSDGPRRVHYDSGGTAYTPGDLSSTGGQLRWKPDLTGADGVSTAAPGFNPFFGTSAAAPHLAGIAALLFEAGGGIGATNIEVRFAMESSALDIEAVGDDRDSGKGIATSVAAAAVLLPEPGAVFMLAAGGLLVCALSRRRRA